MPVFLQFNRREKHNTTCSRKMLCKLHLQFRLCSRWELDERGLLFIGKSMLVWRTWSVPSFVCRLDRVARDPRPVLLLLLVQEWMSILSVEGGHSEIVAYWAATCAGATQMEIVVRPVQYHPMILMLPLNHVHSQTMKCTRGGHCRGVHGPRPQINPRNQVVSVQYIGGPLWVWL